LVSQSSVLVSNVVTHQSDVSVFSLAVRDWTSRPLGLVFFWRWCRTLRFGLKRVMFALWSVKRGKPLFSKKNLYACTCSMQFHEMQTRDKIEG
jgi:hypothetical protein